MNYKVLSILSTLTVLATVLISSTASMVWWYQPREPKSLRQF